MSTDGCSGILVCPETKMPLRRRPINYAESVLSPGASLEHRKIGTVQPIGRTPTVMLSEAGGCAYPVLNGIPILLVPEMLVPPERLREFNLADKKYAEAYMEMEFYNTIAEERTRSLENSSENLGLTSCSLFRSCVFSASTMQEEMGHSLPHKTVRISGHGQTGRCDCFGWDQKGYQTRLQRPLV